MPHYGGGTWAGIEGFDRTQSLLFPERLDDWVDNDSTVRVVDVSTLGAWASSAPRLRIRAGPHTTPARS
jgi:hypothetical protein